MQAAIGCYKTGLCIPAVSLFQDYGWLSGKLQTISQSASYYQVNLGLLMGKAYPTTGKFLSGTAIPMAY
ncbi:hypothetical protein [Chitinophaga sp. GbtcB8]|uniref:hypothetical protein n=1 Tax=Chitinophaga sp. GbtcB8 TaxID=2824753 RepID=UPI001C31101C|nr:hypothetical protein [Chitinophaga sp. GbtcB8]